MRGMRKKADELAKRRWILLGVWILSLVGISFYGGAVSYGIFFGVTLIPLISLAYLLAVYIFFRIYQKVESRDMVCGQPAPYFFILQNDSVIPFSSVSVKLFSSFSFVEKMPENTEYELLCGDKYTFETKLTCKYRGEYEVGVKEIIVTDYFRLFRLRYHVPNTIRAIVKPKITRVSKLISIGEMISVLQTQSMHAGSEPDVTVRDYVPGDAIKNISWKTSARENKLKVRNRIAEEKQGIVLFGDTKRYSGQIEEYLPLENKMLEIMVALGIYLAEQSMPFTAYYGQGKTVSKRVNGVREFNEYYENVSRIIYSDAEDVAGVMHELMAKGAFSNCKVAFGIIHEMNQDIMEMTEQLSQSGILVVLYVVTEEKYEEYIKLNNERRNIITVPVDAQLEGRL